MRASRQLLPLLLMTGLAAASGLASISQGDITFAIDTAVFSLVPGSDSLVLEVYQEIDVEQFAFDASGLSLFTTEAYLLDTSGDTTVIQRWNSEVEWSRGRSVVNGTLIPVSSGEYVLVVVVSDRGNGRQGTVERDILIDIPETVSQIELARFVMPASDESSNVLRKGGVIVYPAADSRFVLPGESLAFVYLEIYNAGGMTYSLQSRLVSPTGETLFARPWNSFEIPDGMSVVGILDSLDLSAAAGTGLYRIRVFLAAGSDTLVVEKPLMISRMSVQEEIAAAPVDSSARCTEQLALLLSEGELDIFGHLDEAARNRFYDEYWSSSSSERVVFESRCRESNRFSFLGREGWQTDRGRVYVKYGVPDDREIVPLTSGQVPYEIWRYYSGGGDEFVFVDTDGSGSYLQVYSTVDGEISFDNWQDFLSPIGGSRSGASYGGAGGYL